MARDWIMRLCDRWDREAFELEKMADRKGTEHTELERRMLRLHARVKRGNANELRIEARKLSNG